MAKFIDYYKILGVKRDTPQDELKTAYRKRSKQFHPDLHPDDPKAKAKFQLLNEAYAVLSDPEKRAKYDQYGEQWDKVGFGGQDAGGTGGFGGFGDGGFNFDFGSGGSGFSDFFESLFGSLGRRRSSRSSSRSSASASQSAGTVQASTEIDMWTAALGGDIIIQSPSGQKLRLHIKPGTQPGTKVRLKGKGNVGSNGVAGDIILTLNVSIPKNLTAEQQELLAKARG